MGVCHTLRATQSWKSRETPVIGGLRCVQSCSCDWAPGVLEHLIPPCFTDTTVFTNWRFAATLGWPSQHHFSNSLLTLCLCVMSHCEYFQLLHCYIYYDTLWSVIFDVTATTHWRFRWWLAIFLAVRYLLIEVWTLVFNFNYWTLFKKTWYACTLRRRQCTVNLTSGIGEPGSPCDLLDCGGREPSVHDSEPCLLSCFSESA